MKLLALLSVCMLLTISGIAQQTIEFPSKDGLTITADLYKLDQPAPFILLFHQAGWSRGEYKEIAPQLNALGYHCLAVDLRSGGAVNRIENETAKRAEQQAKSTNYVNAFQDIEASVNYVKRTYRPDSILLWGSSYSSALVLKYAGDFPESVTAVLSFSPGEYFGATDFIRTSAQHITVPTFITSAKSEMKTWQQIHNAINTKTKQFYLPTTDGNHGARALWKKFSDSSGYWEAVRSFLATI